MGTLHARSTAAREREVVPAEVERAAVDGRDDHLGRVAHDSSRKVGLAFIAETHADVVGLALIPFAKGCEAAIAGDDGEIIGAEEAAIDR